jgi:hypothetical protein
LIYEQITTSAGRAMRNSIFDWVGNLDTLLAVILGAALATLGAFISEVIHDHRGAKKKERATARFVGEILTSIDQLVDLGRQSQAIGDPWGRISVRLYESALREAAVYERNRERLFDIHDMELRLRIHAHVLGETIPLMALLEQCRQIAELDQRQAQSEQDREAIRAQKGQLERSRSAALDGLLAERAQTDDLLAALSKVARASLKSKFLPTYSPQGIPTWRPRDQGIDGAGSGTNARTSAGGAEQRP